MNSANPLVGNTSVVDLFCGIGGMTHGFIKEGFHVAAGIDVDPTCRFPYERNNGARFVPQDVTKLTSSELISLFPEGQRRVLIGCAPCQPFSTYSQLKDKDEKWKLLRTFAQLAQAVGPDVISMENVPRLIHHQVFDDFVRDLRDAGYHVSSTLAHGPGYGVPQLRTRLVLLASRLGEISLLPPTHPKSRQRTVRQVIGKLPSIAAGEAHEADPLHQSRNLTQLNLLRIRSTTEGGSWADWTDELKLACHKTTKGKTFRSVYGRMEWDAPAPTITTQCVGLGNGRFGHPDQDRALSLREAALLQTFPRSYRFVEPGSEIIQQTIARHIGNAVPVRLGRIIARSIRRHLEASVGDE
jgi:DNA (cytosine-5)-methyltransferase 1